jgi:alkanesulfonate monooxygenase SsuD/methylene tetrahydromethanopterin reductase-like flavin-dependent oxidoreductase (luciferase family)
MVLPWHNPVLLAEQAATLDLMSGGRLDFGVGKGYRHTEFTGFCVPPAEADARFEEALDFILKAWTTRERFSHHGRFWRFEDVVVEPPTLQQPHPPIWMAAGSLPSVRKVAARGFNLILDQFASEEQLTERIATFHAESVGFGAREVAVAREMFVAHSQAEKDAAIARNHKARQQILGVSRAPGQERGSHILAYASELTPSDANTLIGTPDEIAQRLEGLRKAGATYLILSCHGSREGLRRFAREIMPAFAEDREPGNLAQARTARGT